MNNVYIFLGFLIVSICLKFGVYFMRFSRIGSESERERRRERRGSKVKMNC